MAENSMIDLSALHVLGAISFEAKRISAVVDFHATGGPFPNPDDLLLAIGRMENLTKALRMYLDAAAMQASQMSGKSAMSAELT